MAKWRESIGVFYDSTVATAVQQNVASKFYNDGTARSERIDYYPADAYNKGWRPGAADQLGWWTGIDAPVNLHYSRGYRHALIIVNTRAPGFPTVYKGDGDFLLTTAPDVVARKAAIRELCQDLAAHLVATFPGMSFAYECGNEITNMTDAAGLRSIPKYMPMFKEMKAGLVAGDATCMVSPGSTLLVKTNKPTGAAGSNFYNVPYNSGQGRTWGPTDQIADMCNTAVVGAGLTLQAIGCHFVSVHPYCHLEGPFGVNATPAGAIGPDVPINGTRELKYIRQKLDAAGLTTIPIWATEIGFPTAAYWQDLFNNAAQIQAGQVVFDPAGAGPTGGGTKWSRGTLWISSTTHTPTNSNRPGQAGGTMWSHYTAGSYNAGEGAGTLNEENEAGQHWRNALRIFFGEIDDVDGVNLASIVKPGSAPSRIYLFIGADEAPMDRFKYGVLKPDGLTPKGVPTSSGPYAQFQSVAGNDDLRSTQPPSPPTSVTATAGNGIALVNWSAPADQGGGPITQYRVTSAPGGLVQTTSSASTSLTMTGLTNGVTYTFTVVAINAYGPSASSAASNNVTPSATPPAGSVPDAPVAVGAVAGDRSASMLWTPGASNGGQPILRYRVTRQPGAVVQYTPNAGAGIGFTGLTNGVSYTFTVAAQNAVGYSAESPPSNAVVPTAGAAPPPPPPPVVALPWAANVPWASPNYDWIGVAVVPGEGGGPGPGPGGGGGQTRPWKVKLRNLTIGEGTDFPWLPREAGPIDLGSEVPYRAVRTDNQQAHGASAPGRDWMGPKLLTFRTYIGFNALVESQADGLALIEILNGAWRPASSDEGDRIALKAETPLRDYFFFGKPDRKPTIDIAPLDQRYATAELVWNCSDPRAYGDEIIVPFTIDGGTGGLGFPHGFPHGFGTSKPGTLTLANVGTVETPWVLTISADTEDVSDPVVQIGDARLTFSVTLTVNGPSLQLDSRLRRVVLGTRSVGFADGARRGDLLVRPGAAWADLEPGDNVVQLSARVGRALGDISYRPAWIL